MPPPLPPTNRANSTPALDNHPGDHNEIVAAIATVSASLDSLIATVASMQTVITAIQGTLTSMQATDASLQSQINAIGSSGHDATTVAAALASHVAATTSVHGIPDTADLLGSSNNTVDDIIEVAAVPGSPVTGRLYLIPST